MLTTLRPNISAAASLVVKAVKMSSRHHFVFCRDEDYSCSAAGSTPAGCTSAFILSSPDKAAQSNGGLTKQNVREKVNTHKDVMKM